MSNDNQQKTDWAAISKGFLLLAATFGIAAYFLWYIGSSILALKSEMATAIVAGIFTILVSVGSLIWTHHRERMREIEQEHRKQVIPVYSEFVHFWFDMLSAEKLGRQPKTETEVLAFFIGFTEKIIMWGSDKVLREYLNFRGVSQDLALPTPESMTPEEFSHLNNVKMLLSFENG